MRKLSKGEWIAIVVAVVFVSYTLFGDQIISLFQKSTGGDDSLATVTDSVFSNDGVIINNILVGQGAEVKTGQLISAHYVLSLPDGTMIQNSKDFEVPFQFTLGAGQVIPGWEIGFAGMRVGGIRTITVPPELAYGPNQIGPIPPNSTLIFTIELLDAQDVVPEPIQ